MPKPAGWTKAAVPVATREAAEAIGELDELVVALDFITDRDLKKYPPLDTETMSFIGLDAYALVRLRKHVNARYRVGKRQVTSLDLKGDTKFSDLKKLCGF